MSQMGKFISAASIGAVVSLTGDVGGAVSPDGVGNIDTLGTAGQILVTGNPGANSLTASIVNGTNGQLLIGGGAAATWAPLTSVSGTITFVTGINTLDLNVGGIVAVSFPTDVGTATPAIGVLTVSGGTNINTSGAGSVVTVNLDAAISGMTSVDFATGGRVGTDTGAGDTYLLQAYDVDGVSYTTFATLTANNTPTMDLDDTVTKAGNYIYRVGGTDVSVSDGGTGVSSITDHSLIVGSGVGAITELGVATNGQLPIGSTGADPVLAALTGGNNIGVTNGAGTISIAVNGTTQYAVQVGDATGSLDSLAIGTATQVLQSGGAGVNPSWSTATYPVTTSQGDILYSSSANTIVGLAKDATATRYLANTGASNNPAWDQIELTNGVSGILPVTNGGTGASSITDHSLIVGSGTSPVTELGVATDGQIPIGSSAADPVLGAITSVTDLTVTNGAGTISIDLTADTNLTAVHGWNGSLLETATVTVTAAGGVITLSIEKFGTGNLTAVFSDGFDTWVTAPDTVTLTAGSDISPKLNYVYYLQSTKTLTANITGWPATEYAAVATVLCQSAASLQTDGAYKVHAWTDHVTNPVDQGHVSMINKWIRQQNATWKSDVAPTLTITPNGGSADNVIFTCTAGLVYQLHAHTFPAFAGTPDVYTVNDFTTPYNIVTDLNALLTDSANASMSGRYFSLVIWGVVSEATGDCKLMVNLPGGSYTTSAGITADDQRYADFSIPSDFKGTGFLIYQMNLKHSVAASGTWTSIENIDLRGLFPSLAAGGGTAAGTEFADNAFRIFDDGDSTKELAFEVSAVTTATTRTITMDDRNIDMDAVPDSFATDGAAATPAAGILTIIGSGTLSTSGAGSTVTISGGGIEWSEATGATQAMVVNNGYTTNNGAQLDYTLPATAAVGDICAIAGNSANGWTLSQNAGQTVHFISDDTTPGAGGSLSSTVRYDCIELVCVTANTDFTVRSSTGNITVV